MCSHKLKSLSYNHIKILQGRKQNGQEIARARFAIPKDDFKFSSGAAAVGVTDMLCLPCSSPEPV